MDKLQQVKAKLEEMKAKYNQERDEEENPLHSDGNGMYWSGFFTCLKEITSIVDSLPEESANEDLEEEIDAWCQKAITGLPIVKEAARHFAEWQKKHIWTEEVEKIIRKKLESDYRQANSMVIWASRSDKPFDNDEELIMVEESANTIINLIKKEIGV